MKLYKFTDRHYMTRNNTWWGEGVTHKLKPHNNPSICSNRVIHAYRNLDLAFVFKDAHTSYKEYTIWECEGSEIVDEDFTKCGVYELTTVKQLMIPSWYESKYKNSILQLFNIRVMEKAFGLLDKEGFRYDIIKSVFEAIIINYDNSEVLYKICYDLNVYIKNNSNFISNLDNKSYHFLNSIHDYISGNMMHSIAYCFSIFKNSNYTYDELVNIFEECKSKFMNKE